MRGSLPIRLAALVAAGVLFTSCGVSGGEDSSSDTTEAKTTTTAEETTTTEAEETTTTEADDPERSDADQEMVDQLTDVYTGLGLEQADAECLAGAIFDLGDDFDPEDTGAMMDIVNECDIPMSDLAGLSEGAGSAEEAFKLGLTTSLTQSGLTEEQANCVADAYVAEFGTEVAPSTDTDAMAGLLQECGVL